MGWEHLVARKFGATLRDKEFEILGGPKRITQKGQPFWRYSCLCRDRIFFLDCPYELNPESWTDNTERLAKILEKPECGDISPLSPVHHDNEYGEVLMVEARCHGQKFRVFTQINEKQPSDEFSLLANSD